MRAKRLSSAHVVALLALVAALGGSAIAATGGPTADSSQSAKAIKACAVKKGKKKGQLRLATRGKCKKSERKVSWNAAGAPGAPGANGQNGQNGVGVPGAAGPTGPAGVAPAGAVMAFDLAACPSGWTEFAPAKGRYIVGTPTGGANGSTVGTALADQENRPTGVHDHGVTDPGHTHNMRVSPILVGGNVVPDHPAGTTSESQLTNVPSETATTGVTVNPSAGVAGTNAPYVQLLVCEKS